MSLYLDLHCKRGDAGVLSSPYDHLLERVPLVVGAHGALLGRVLSNGALIHGKRQRRGGRARGAALERALHPSRQSATHLRETQKSTDNREDNVS